MSLNDIKIEFFKNRVQVVSMTSNFFLIESCNTIINLDHNRNEPLTQVLSFLKKYKSGINRLSEGRGSIKIKRAIHAVDNDESKFLHVEIFKFDGNIVCVFENISSFVNDVEQYEVLDKSDGELLAEVQHLRQLRKMKQEYFSKITHDIKLPLTEIVGTSFLLKNFVHEKKGHDYVRALGDAASSLDNMLSDLLEFSRLEAFDVKFESKEFNLEKLIWSVIRTFDYKSKQRGIPFYLSIDESIPDIIIGDPQRLSQIVYNLLDNAIKFTVKGRININVSLASVEEKQCSVNFTIQDSGIGIPEENLTSIFNAYEQVEHPIGSQEKGFGLGLSIVKQLVEMQNGTIKVESAPDMGTTFTFDLLFQLPELQTT